MQKPQLNNLLQKNGKSIVTVFLHGFMGDYKTFNNLTQFPEFQRISDALLVDLTNHGDSYHKNNFEFQDFKNDVLSTMEDLKLFTKYDQGK